MPKKTWKDAELEEFTRNILHHMQRSFCDATQRGIRVTVIISRETDDIKKDMGLAVSYEPDDTSVKLLRKLADQIEKKVIPHRATVLAGLPDLNLLR